MKGPSQQPLQALPEGFVPHNSFHRQDLDDKLVILRMAQDRNRLRTRKCTVEHPFGTIKWHHGAHHALLKGRSRVAGEYALSFLVYNMRRALKLTGMESCLTCSGTGIACMNCA